MKNIGDYFDLKGNIMQKRSKKDMINGEVEPRIDSQRGVLSDNAPTVSAVSGSNFVISGKNIAPVLRSAADICSDDALVGLALNGHELEDIANTVGVPAADADPAKRLEVFNRLGRPETVDGYELVPPENLPDWVSFEDESVQAAQRSFL